MPIYKTVIRVFVSSPSDVQDEREVLESVLIELNRSWSNRLNLLFELLDWKTHTYPAFSGDPQSVINDQIGDDYDVFIGILWGRFGTQTPRALSGTHEEFNRALQRHQRSASPEMMIYFKDSPISPSEINLEQLGQVLKFKASLSKLGGLYSAFSDLQNFESSLRSHLSAVAQKFADGGGVSKGSVLAKASERIDDIDELGFLDYVEIYQARTSDMSATLETITEATFRIGEQTNQRVAEIDKHEKPIVDVGVARRIIKKSAGDLASYADTLAQTIPLFAEARTEAFQALSRGLAMRADFSTSDDEELETLSQGLTSMYAAVAGAKLNLVGFRNSMQGIPRITLEINKAKRSSVAQMDSMLEELDNTCSIVQNLLESITKMRK